MYCHKYFNLCLHETTELEEILQDQVVERKTLHEWPLSCVELIITKKGEKHIYKSQFGPTVEADFYARAKSDLIISGKTLRKTKTGYVNMLFDYIEEQPFANLSLTDDEVVAKGKDILKQLENIGNDLPYYLDISCEQNWFTAMGKMLLDLKALVSSGNFTEVDTSKIEVIQHLIGSDQVLKALSTNVGLTHNDLSGENVFIVANEYRIIDWQRPVLGPRAVDFVNLLESMKIEPTKYVEVGTVLIMYLLRIHWLTEAATRWFPEGVKSYDRSIAQHVLKIEQSA